MKRDYIAVIVLWLVLTAIGLGALLGPNIYPVAAAEEAEHLDGAFRQLVIMGMPVFTFVLAVLIYSLWRFRAANGPTEAGAPIYGHKVFSISWLVITSALAVLLFYTPGVTGILFLRSNPNADMVVQVEAAQWHWHITYPEQGLSIKSGPVGFEAMDRNAVLALPVDRRVKFEITSADIIHSFWIPAFRMKIDAVPGMTTTMYVTPNRVGDFEENFNYRVQCAELCGTGHPRMNMRVAVMEPAEFEEWVTAQMQMESMGGMQMDEDGEEHDE